MATAARDVCSEMTAKIVDALEKGVAPWVKPWSGDAGVPTLSGMPRNAVTGRAYHGGNVLVLWCAGYADPRWLTFKQALALGGCVRKGERGTTVCFWTSVPSKKAADATAEGGGEETTKGRKRLICRAYTVFNVEQVDGLALDAEAPTAPAELGVADAVAERVGAKVTRGGSKAFYSPTADAIAVPVRAAFTDEGAYDGTLLHELTHWTGHKSRCDRDFSKSKRFGDDAYAFEELVAELGSAFACAQLGVVGRLQHTEYLCHWAKVLKGDRYAIFTAAKLAEKAVDFILHGEGVVPEEVGQEEVAQAA